jgi:hypothetical protein
MSFICINNNSLRFLDGLPKPENVQQNFFMVFLLEAAN